MKKVISKFGGSSMADYESMARSARILLDQNSMLVVVSATYGTTNQLVELKDFAINSQWDECEKILFKLRQKHYQIINTLNERNELRSEINEKFNQLETILKGISLLGECTPRAFDQVISFGERISSLIFKSVLSEISDKKIIRIEAFKYIKTDSNYGSANVDIDLTKKMCSTLELNSQTIFITQGFIASNEDNLITTLGRGGSDYSASIFAEALNADILEIWTDVPGIASADPRICSNALFIEQISYNEACEMAQYGAKVLHPATLIPALRQNIPVYVGSSYNSEIRGTWIKEEVCSTPLLRAITHRSKQSLMTIKTPRMLNAYGFLGKIFDVFAEFKISVDCVTTSEISVAVTIDESQTSNKELIKKLELLGEVEIEKSFALISLIGNGISQTSGFGKRLFTVIDGFNIRLICLGASNYNLNILVQDCDVSEIITKIHSEFIEVENENSTSR